VGSEKSEESEAERLDRNFDDLLQELRVSQNGTQILFAFLLTVPFSNGFEKVTGFQRGVYFAALLLAGLSAAMLIAPAAMHRILFRSGLKKELVHAATRVTLGGQVLLIAAVAVSVFLIGDYLYGHAVGITLGLAMGLYWTLWFVLLPLWIKRHGDQSTRSST
jgi:tellurite resistance protein TehA-like permease